MLEETPQHTDQESAESKSHLHASSKDVTLIDPVQIHPAQGQNQNDAVIAIVRLVCIAVAVFNYVTTRELISFLILVGIAIDPSRIWEAIKLFTPKLPPAPKEAKKQERILENREDNEEL